MSRLLLVTTELSPETSGPAGHAVEAIAREYGGIRSCTVLLLGHQEQKLAPHGGFEVVEARIPRTGVEARSAAAAEAISRIVEPGDRLEIQDLGGIAFHALANRRAFGLERTLVTIRLHTPGLEGGTDSGEDETALRRLMGAEAYRMADLVLIPALGHRRALVEDLEVEPERVILSPPPIPPTEDAARRGSVPDETPAFTVIGPVSASRGSEEVVRASMRLLAEGLGVRVRLIGEVPDREPGGFPPPWPEAAWGDHSEVFEWHPRVGLEDLPHLITGTAALIVPDPQDTFSIPAHMARQMGIAVIVNRQAENGQGLERKTGAVVYNGMAGLTRAMRRFAKAPQSALRLGSKPAPSLADTWAAYMIGRQPRHPRSQAGLGTVAVQRLQMATAGPDIATGPVASRDKTPPTTDRSPAGRTADGPLLPENPERREAADLEKALARIAAVRARIDSGEFAEVDSPDVSVVIPVFNGVAYLEETLTSVYEQTHDSWEIIIVDDGSTNPDTLRWLRTLKRPRVQVLHQAHKGAAAARNKGMGVARGKYLISLDSDDELTETYIEEMMAALESNAQAAYAHCCAVLYQDVDALWITRPFNKYWQLLGNGVVGCVLMRKEAWESVGGYDETMMSSNEDWELWIRLMAAGWDQVHVQKPLFKYRKHGVSMSVLTESKFEEGRRRVRDRHPDLYSALPETKRVWYPLMTLVWDGPTRYLEDVELVSSIDRARHTWGKYIADVRGLASIPTRALTYMAEAMEAEPNAALALSRGVPPLVLHRRWNVHDPGASPSLEITVEDPTAGPGDGIPRVLPREGWAAPEVGPDEWRPVHRQIPEEAGRMPDVTKW